MRKLILIIVIFFSNSLFAYELSYLCGPGTSANAKGFVKHEITFYQNKNIEVKNFLNFGERAIELTSDNWTLMSINKTKLNRSNFDPDFYYFEYVTDIKIEQEGEDLFMKEIYYWEVTSYKTSYYYKVHQLKSLNDETWFDEDYSSGNCTLISID